MENARKWDKKLKNELKINPFVHGYIVLSGCLSSGFAYVNAVVGHKAHKEVLYRQCNPIEQQTCICAIDDTEIFRKNNNSICWI